MKVETKEELLWAYSRGWRDFPRIDLERAQLEKIVLSAANLSHANFHTANLREASLCGTGLHCADFSSAILIGTNFQCAHFHGTCFIGADLRGAHFGGASLRRANLYEAQIGGANLYGASYSPIALLAAIYWGDLSPELTRELMRWDESCRIFGGPSFQGWAKGKGKCPFGGLETRAFKFQERREYYKRGKPKMTLAEVFRAACKEKNINLDDPDWVPPPLEIYYTETAMDFC